MAENTVKSPKVFGILSICFGSIIMFFNLISLAGMSCATSLMKPMGQLSLGNKHGDMASFMELYSEIIRSSYVSMAVFFLCSALLLALGIGQVKYKKWAAKMTIIWSICGLIALVLLAIYSIVVIGPLTEKLFAHPFYSNMGGQQMSAGLFSGIGKGTSVLSAIGSIIFYAPYPILMLIFFNKKQVKDSLVN